MEVSWGDGFGEDSQGQDILGVRRLDQSLEGSLVNGITTISLRGRYLTILPWAIGEFFEAERRSGATEFFADRLQTFLFKVEYLTLACTSLDKTTGDSGGALGSVTFKKDMDALKAGATVYFPAGRGGSLLGTYFGPCRALGLVRMSGTGSGPLVLTPRGQAIWKARNTALRDGPARFLLHEAESLSANQVSPVVPDFSLLGLAAAVEEASLLRDALLVPWTPPGPAAVTVAEAYARFGETIALLRSYAKEGPLNAEAILTDIWHGAAAAGGETAGVRTAWAEYEWRRRLHYALELMLSAVSATLKEQKEATLAEIVGGWLNEVEVPPMLTELWPQAGLAKVKSGAEAAASVPADLFLSQAPSDSLGDMRPHARALASFALVAALARQSARLRAQNLFADRRSAGERAIATVEIRDGKPFAEALLTLAEVAARAHLETTFRKMADGQKCSLRFFPEGRRLHSTEERTRAGRSGPRLWNVIRVLHDARVDGLVSGS